MSTGYNQENNREKNNQRDSSGRDYYRNKDEQYPAPYNARPEWDGDTDRYDPRKPTRRAYKDYDRMPQQYNGYDAHASRDIKQYDHLDKNTSLKYDERDTRMPRNDEWYNNPRGDEDRRRDFDSRKNNAIERHGGDDLGGRDSHDSFIGRNGKYKDRRNYYDECDDRWAGKGIYEDVRDDIYRNDGDRKCNKGRYEDFDNGKSRHDSYDDRRNGSAQGYPTRFSDDEIRERAPKAHYFSPNQHVNGSKYGNSDGKRQPGRFEDLSVSNRDAVVRREGFNRTEDLYTSNRGDSFAGRTDSFAGQGINPPDTYNPRVQSIRQDNSLKYTEQYEKDYRKKKIDSEKRLMPNDYKEMDERISRTKEPVCNNKQPNMTLGLFNLSPYTTEDDVDEIIKDNLQEVSDYSINVILDPGTGLCRGFCFISFICLEDSINAKNLLNGKAIKGACIKANYSNKTTVQ